MPIKAREILDVQKPDTVLFPIRTKQTLNFDFTKNREHRAQLFTAS